MKKNTKKRSLKAGLPPGSLVYLGDKPKTETKISIINFCNGAPSEITEKIDLNNIQSVLKSSLSRDNISWINIAGVSDTDFIKKFGEQFGIHQLVLEDIVSAVQRPKLDDYGDYIFIALKQIKSAKDSFDFEAEQISIILKDNLLITFEDGEPDFFASVKKDIVRSKNLKAAFLLYLILDIVVDNYFTVLEKIGEDVEALETNLINNPIDSSVSNIYTAKRALLNLRRSVWPLREVLSHLFRDPEMIDGNTKIFLRDVYDHTVEVIDLLETFRDMTSGMLDVYLSSVSNRMNSVMKVLTLIATIFMPITFIASIYGMNFVHMPELNWEYGYPFALGIMLSVSLFMIWWFWRRGWFK